MLRRFWTDRRGATAIEYGLIVVCLSLVIIGGISQTGNAMREMFQDPARALQQTLTP